MNYEKRLTKLEERVLSDGSGQIFGVFRMLIVPGKKDDPMRFAEHEGIRFAAEDGETEDQFCARIEAAMPKEPGKIWRVLMYPTRPQKWLE